jgi:hypothetical protein
MIAIWKSPKAEHVPKGTSFVSKRATFYVPKGAYSREPSETVDIGERPYSAKSGTRLDRCTIVQYIYCREYLYG